MSGKRKAIKAVMSAVEKEALATRRQKVGKKFSGIVTDRLIKKFAGEHGKAAAIRKFGKERVAKVKISTKKIGTPPSKGGYGGGQGEDMIPSQPMTGKPPLIAEDKYPSDISGVSPHVPKGRRGMRKGGKVITYRMTGGQVVAAGYNK
tara:strand:+ start:141 stop:584 length:444 start_codon:yes stop_codon:yes gene_type:complete